MRIVHPVDEKLHIGFENILAGVESRVDFVLDVLQLLCYVDRWLLVPLGGILQVRKRALELERLIIVLEETSGYGRVEGDVAKAFEDVVGPKECITCAWLGTATQRSGVMHLFTLLRCDDQVTTSIVVYIYRLVWRY
jgi:hypothetical protein